VPLPAGPVAGASAGSLQTLVFRTADGHIHRLAWLVGDGTMWHDTDVTLELA
jgi:hypothetical protein